MLKTIENLILNKKDYLANRNNGMITCFDNISDIPQNVETCIIYLRVSTKKMSQDESIDHQYDAALAFCKLHNFIITHILYEKETATSDTMRTQYSQLEPLLKQFKPNYLVAKSSDRLSRNIEGKAHLDNIMKNNQISFAYFMENKIVNISDTSTELSENIQALINSHYSKQQSEKAKEYYKGKRNRKELTKQNECFGYRYDKTTKKMMIDEDEAYIVRRIFEMYVYESKGLTKISNELALLGFTSVPNQKTNSETVSPAWISKVLKRTAYIGDMTFNHRRSYKEEGPQGVSKRVKESPTNYVHAEVPAIVSKEIFYLAQEILAENSQTNLTPTRNTGGFFRGNHLFAGIVFCECGSPFSYKKDYRNPEKIYYYCSHNSKHHKGVCQNTSHYKILEKDLEKIVLKALNEWKQMRKDAGTEILDILKKKLKTKQDNNSQLKIYMDRKKELEMQARNILDLLISAQHDSLIPIYTEKLDKINSDIATLDKKIELETHASKSSVDIDKRLTNIIESLDSFTEIKSLTREIVLKHIDKILIHYDGAIDIYMKYANSSAKMPLFNKEGLCATHVVKIEILDDPY